MYKLPYVLLLGLSLPLHDVYIKESPDYYKIMIKDQPTIQVIQEIEEYLSKCVHKYRSILNNNGSEYYITLRKNTTISIAIKKYRDQSTIPISLFKIKKYASHSQPIVYIL